MTLVTYETIRNMQRQEKDLPTLQPLPEGFFPAVRSWLIHKQKFNDTTSLLEIENGKKLIEDLINRRERKLVTAALHTIRGDVPPLMLKEEQKFFDEIVKMLKEHRACVCESVFGLEAAIEDKINSAKESIEALKQHVGTAEAQENQQDKKLVRILADMPAFIGTDTKTYGPLKPGDLAVLPQETAKLLLERHTAEEVGKDL